jgi:hypothetical protein
VFYPKDKSNLIVSRSYKFYSSHKLNLIKCFRYREKDSKFPNWLELPVNPPNARKVEIHNLASNTKYEFQVMGINQYGDGMFSEIIEASTKGNFDSEIGMERILTLGFYELCL